MNPTHRRILTIATAVTFVTWAGLILVGLPTDRGAVILSNVGQCTAPALAALGCLLASRRAITDRQALGWKLLAAHYAKKSDFKRACELASIYLPSLLRTVPGTSTDVQALERAFLFNPLDARLGIDLFQAYKNRNELDMAIRTLEKVRSTSNPPAYLHQELAAIYMAKEDFRRVWESFSQAMNQPGNNR